MAFATKRQSGPAEDEAPPASAQEPSPDPMPEAAAATTTEEPAVERAQAALQETQAGRSGLQAHRADLLRAYHQALNEADGERMVAVDRQLCELDLWLRAADVRLDAARVGAERAAVQVAESQCRAISVRLAEAKEELRAARTRRQAAWGNVVRERKGVAAEFEAHHRLRALIDEERDACGARGRGRGLMRRSRPRADASTEPDAN